MLRENCSMPRKRGWGHWDIAGALIERKLLAFCLRGQKVGWVWRRCYGGSRDGKGVRGAVGEWLWCWIYDDEEKKEEKWCQMSCIALFLSFLHLLRKCSIRPRKALRSNNSCEDDMFRFANWHSS